MRHATTATAVLLAAATAALGPGAALGQTILSDAYNRTTDNVGGTVSNFGSNDNALGGTVTANYLTTNSANGNQQNVEDGKGVLRFGRTILNYNLATDPTVTSTGGVTIQFNVNPTDETGGGFQGRDFAGFVLADTNSTTLIGGAGALSSGANQNSRVGLGPRNSGSSFVRLAQGATIATRGDGNPFPPDMPTPAQGRANINEPVFDDATFNAYLAAGQTFVGDSNNTFANAAEYLVRAEIASTFAAGAPSTITAFVNGVQLDLDTTLAGVNPGTFTWGANGGMAYLALLSNGGPATVDNLVIGGLPTTVIPEPATAGLVAACGGAVLLRRRSRLA